MRLHIAFATVRMLTVVEPEKTIGSCILMGDVRPRLAGLTGRELKALVPSHRDTISNTLPLVGEFPRIHSSLIGRGDTGLS